jgi:hypothetical protein
MAPIIPERDTPDAASSAPRFITPLLLLQVEEALVRVSPFGEVRLVVQRGRLRFIEVMESHSVETTATTDPGN